MYAVSYDVPIDEERYREIVEKVGPEPVEGRLSHLAVSLPEGAGTRVIEVWDSQEASEHAMTTRVGPAVQGTDLATVEPQELPVVAFSGVFPTVTLWRDAPLRSEPYVREHPSNTTATLTYDPAHPSTTYPVVDQALGQYIDARLHDGRVVWNEYWVYVKVGSHGPEGWLSMVDVDLPGDGVAFPRLHTPEHPFGT